MSSNSRTSSCGVVKAAADSARRGNAGAAARERERETERDRGARHLRRCHSRQFVVVVRRCPSRRPDSSTNMASNTNAFKYFPYFQCCGTASSVAASKTLNAKDPTCADFHGVRGVRLKAWFTSVTRVPSTNVLLQKLIPKATPESTSHENWPTDVHSTRLDGHSNCRL